MKEAKWQTVRVFISSTFRDMQEERDYLVRFVFPKLRETLAERHINLVDVDLRWGVTSDQEALDVCREIIDECRPRFLCLLGERYGWIPPERMHSITEDEVRYGVLDKLDARGHAFFYFRETQATAAIAEAEPGLYREEVGGPLEKKLQALKASICNAGLSTFTYPAHFDKDSGKLTGLEELGERVFYDLLESINNEFGTEQAENPDTLSSERAAIEIFCQEHMQHFVPGNRAPILDQLASWCLGQNGAQIFVLSGPEGIGKSALLAALCERLSNRDDRDRSEPFLLISHFVGTTPGSANLHEMLDRLCRELARFTEKETQPPNELEALVHYFTDSIDQAATVGRVVLVLDGIDQLGEVDHIRGVTWLPREMAPRACIIASTAKQSDVDELNRRQNTTVLAIPPFTIDDTKALVTRFLGRYGKRISEEQMQEFLRKKSADSPLYVLAALEQLRTLGMYEEISYRLRELPNRIDSLFSWILLRLSCEPALHEPSFTTKEEILVCGVTSMLSASRSGLSSQDLSTLVTPGDPHGRLAALLRLLRPYMTNREGLLDFRHRLFRSAACTEYLSSETERHSAHSQLAEHFRSKADPMSDRSWTGKHSCALRELPYHLVQAGKWSELYNIMTDFTYLERRVAQVVIIARNYGTLIVVPCFGSPVSVSCGACGLTFNVNTAAMYNVISAILRCTRCNNTIRLAQLGQMNLVPSQDTFTTVCEYCGTATFIPKKWLAGGLIFVRILCASCGVNSASEQKSHSRARHLGGISLHADYQMIQSTWPEDDDTAKGHEVLLLFDEYLRTTQNAWEHNPAMLFPQMYPRLWWAHGEIRDECRRICEEYSERYDKIGPWLRQLSPPGQESVGEIVFPGNSVVTVIFQLGPSGLLTAGTADGHLLVIDLKSGQTDSLPCGGCKLIAVGSAMVQGRNGALAIAESGQVFSFDPESRGIQKIANVGYATAAAIAGNNGILATGSQWGQIILWDTNSNKRIADAMPRRSLITYLCFSGSGESLLAIYSSGVVAIFETDSLTQSGVTPRSKAQGIFLPAMGENAWWFLQPGGQIHRFTATGRATVAFLSFPAECLSAASLSENGDLAVIGTVGGCVKLIPIAKEGIAREFSMSSPVTALLLTSDSKWIAVGYEKGGGKALRIDTEAIESGSSPQSSSAPASIHRGSIVLGTKPGRCISLSGQTDENGTILPGAFRFDGPTASAIAAPVYAATSDGYWKAWDVVNCSELGSAPCSGGIRALALSPNGDIICTGSSTGVVTAWDSMSGAERGRFEPGKAAISGLAFAPDGEHLFCVDSDASASAWKLTVPKESRGTRYIVFSRGGESMSGLLLDISFHSIWKQMLDTRPSSLSMSPDGELIAVGAEDRIQIINAKTGEFSRELDSSIEDWHSVAFSPHGLLLGVSYRGAIQVWDIDNDRPLCSYKINPGTLGGAWHPNGNKFCVTHSDGGIFWFELVGHDAGKHWVVPVTNSSFGGSNLFCSSEGCDGHWEVLSPSIGDDAKCTKCGKTYRIAPHAKRLYRLEIETGKRE